VLRKEMLRSCFANMLAFQCLGYAVYRTLLLAAGSYCVRHCKL
jgi:hypothetical protein